MIVQIYVALHAVDNDLPAAILLKYQSIIDNLIGICQIPISTQRLGPRLHTTSPTKTDHH